MALVTMMADTLADVLRSNRSDVKDWTADQLCDGIAAAIRERDFEAVKGFMFLLAVKDPKRAQTVHDMIQAVGEGDERRAFLLAALG